jgi:ATP synthase protein I
MTELNKSNGEQDLAKHNVEARAVYRNMLRWQWLSTLAVAIIALLLAGIHAAVSVVLGGASVITGAYVASKVAANVAENAEASTVLINMLKAEAIKIALIALILFVVFKNYAQLVHMALIAGLAAAALFSGAALAKLKTPI